MGGDVTRILSAIEAGDRQAAEQLMPLVYDELRQLASARLAHEQRGQSLQATALVHEAYLRLVDDSQARQWDSRGHFFKAAAEAMRRILIDRARKRKRDKHGGDRQRIEFEETIAVAADQRAEELLAVDVALEKLAAIDQRKAELVKLRFYAGLTIPEAAAALEISHATAERDWSFARAWLYDALTHREKE